MVPDPHHKTPRKTNNRWTMTVNLQFRAYFNKRRDKNYIERPYITLSFRWYHWIGKIAFSKIGMMAHHHRNGEPEMFSGLSRIREKFGWLGLRSWLFSVISRVIFIITQKKLKIARKRSFWVTVSTWRLGACHAFWDFGSELRRETLRAKFD